MYIFIDLLLLTVLASMANQLKKPILCGLIFGILKATGLYLLHIAELESSVAEAGIVGVTHFAINALLGWAIAYVVVNHSKDAKMVILMSALSVLSFLTHFASLNITSL